MEKNFDINLKEYIEQDIIYQDYKKGKLEDKSDFDEFCINHCEDIKNALDEILKLKDKYDKDIEYLGKIADDYRDKNKELKSLCDKYEEEHNTIFQEWQKDINIINELEKYLKEQNDEHYSWHYREWIKQVLNKLNELKGDNK